MVNNGQSLGKQKPIQNKNVFRLIVKYRWKDKARRRGMQLAQGNNSVLQKNRWCHGLESSGNANSLVHPKIRHWQKQMVE